MTQRKFDGNGLFDRFVRFRGGENDVWFHSVSFGDRVVTVVNYSPDWRVQTGNEAKREQGTTNRKITADKIRDLHKLADRVRSFYGNDAVGALPAIPKKRNRKRAA